MSEELGCPEGMYPMDATYDDGDIYEDFEEFKAHAEGASNLLNLPISYYFHPGDESEDGEPYFQLVLLMPRKYGSTWAINTKYDSREQVLAWLNPWLKGQYDNWFDWNATTPKGDL